MAKGQYVTFFDENYTDGMTLDRLKEIYFEKHGKKPHGALTVAYRKRTGGAKPKKKSPKKVVKKSPKKMKAKPNAVGRFVPAKKTPVKTPIKSIAKTIGPLKSKTQISKMVSKAKKTVQNYMIKGYYGNELIKAAEEDKVDIPKQVLKDVYNNTKVDSAKKALVKRAKAVRKGAQLNPKYDKGLEKIAKMKPKAIAVNRSAPKKKGLPKSGRKSVAMKKTGLKESTINKLEKEQERHEKAVGEIFEKNPKWLRKMTGPRYNLSDRVRELAAPYWVGASGDRPEKYRNYQYKISPPSEDYYGHVYYHSVRGLKHAEDFNAYFLVGFGYGRQTVLQGIGMKRMPGSQMRKLENSLQVNVIRDHPSRQLLLRYLDLALTDMKHEYNGKHWGDSFVSKRSPYGQMGYMMGFRTAIETKNTVRSILNMDVGTTFNSKKMQYFKDFADLHKWPKGNYWKICKRVLIHAKRNRKVKEKILDYELNKTVPDVVERMEAQEEEKMEVLPTTKGLEDLSSEFSSATDVEATDKGPFPEDTPPLPENLNPAPFEEDEEISSEFSSATPPPPQKKVSKVEEILNPPTPAKQITVIPTLPTKVNKTPIKQSKRLTSRQQLAIADRAKAYQEMRAKNMFRKVPYLPSVKELKEFKLRPSVAVNAIKRLAPYPVAKDDVIVTSGPSTPLSQQRFRSPSVTPSPIGYDNDEKELDALMGKLNFDESPVKTMYKPEPFKPKSTVDTYASKIHNTKLGENQSVEQIKEALLQLKEKHKWKSWPKYAAVKAKYKTTKKKNLLK